MKALPVNNKIAIILALVTFQTYLAALPVVAQTGTEFTIARIQYRGGGDWYNDPSALTNLIQFAKRYVPIAINARYEDVAVGSRDLFKYPFAFMTGHGNITLNSLEAKNMRDWLDNGGFLFIDDDYGFDPYMRKAMAMVFPDEKWIELPFSHPIYNTVFPFTKGLPKIHEHDNKPPQGFGLFRNGRLVVYYTYESNLGDGWTDPQVHNNPASLREASLKMGVNILIFALTGLQ